MREIVIGVDLGGTTAHRIGPEHRDVGGIGDPHDPGIVSRSRRHHRDIGAVIIIRIIEPAIARHII